MASSSLPALVLALTLAAACSTENDPAVTSSEPSTGQRRDAGSKASDEDDPEPDQEDEAETKDAGADRTRDASRDARAQTLPSTGDGGEQQCAAIREDAPAAQATPVDVVFVIDTSGSMRDEQAKVKANIQSFVNDFADSNADTHVVMITGEDPAAGSALGADGERYRFIQTGVESKVLFAVTLATLPLFVDVLRPNALTHFVFVSDDEDLLPPPIFRGSVEGTLGHSFVAHAVASENVNGRPCSPPNPGLECAFTGCGAAAIGATYYSLADQTGGETLSICTEDWTEVFGRLKSAVVEAVPLPCDYPLAKASSPEFDKSKVQVVYTPEGGEEGQIPKAMSRDQCGDKPAWFYDNEEVPTSITLCPAACEAVAAGGAMDIAFGCEPAPVII